MGKYYLGLDMGTNSVGWAVTDDKYQLLRAKGKDLWGARLFSEAETAAARRSNRTARRRLQRQKVRNGYLRELFADAINSIDPGFSNVWMIVIFTKMIKRKPNHLLYSTIKSIPTKIFISNILLFFT